MALSKNGYEIEVAGSVREAKERLKEKFDLLLLDVALPDGTGYEICREVRGKDSRIPIIFLTAADDEMSIVRGLDGGGDDYVTKPFETGGTLLQNPRASAPGGTFRRGKKPAEIRRDYNRT